MNRLLLYLFCSCCCCCLLPSGLRSSAQPAARPSAKTRDSDDKNRPEASAELFRGLIGTREALLFDNGDFLFGQLESIGPDRITRWKHPDADNSIEFRAEAISDIFFRNQPGNRTTNNCLLRLTNDDFLEGTLLSCDETQVVLQTWYAGVLTLPRIVIQSLFPLAINRPAIFTGPTGLDGWTIGKVSTIAEPGEWRYRNGAFYATKAASIARDLNLPDNATIQFDLAWRGAFHFAIALYTDYLYPINLASKDSEPDFGGFYSLQFNNYSANLLPIRKKEPLKYLGQAAMIPVFNQKNSARVEIRVSKARNLIALLIDGAVVRHWVDSDKFVGAGTGIRLVHQGQGAIKIYNLVVTEWDGQFEDRTSSRPDMHQDIGRLRNGDKVAGVLQNISNEKAVFNMNSGNLDIPFYRIKQIDFAGEKLVRNRDSISEVRAHFATGGTITFQIEKWDKQEILASSPNFGKATFSPQAFSRLQFRFQ